ncbi:Pr6Pr family membrane protein [Catenulispora rubra]|uniref:Pr6Pr family membrane protein n=1 Tax=Catenulispora rubra TaxID=280293 RepID=UPI0018925B97|nr:Pr6Pr family membrane protein [Catenulispora rubra]
MTIERARAWHLLTVLVCAASLVLQFYLSAANKNTQVSPFTVGTRIGNFFCFFTIQSNLIVLAVAIALVLVPDRRGAWWPVALLDALLCITVTCLVDVVVLRPQQHLGGWSNVADLGLHVVTPILLVVGWLLFGPRPRLAWATLGWSTVYPLAWVAFTLIRGHVVNWYPYPFIDVSTHGYARVTLNVAMVAVLLLALGAVFVWLDRRLPRAPVQP